MRISSNTRRAMLGMVLAAAATGSIVQAQGNAAGRPLPVPPPGGPQGDIVIKCCRCLGQESGAVNISTGTAPWRVSSVIKPVWPNPGLTGPTNPSPLMMPGVISNPHPNWGPLLGAAKWLQPIGSTMRNDAFPQTGHVTYVLKIRVPNCAIKQKVVLSGQLQADDRGTMTVNTLPVPLSGGPAGFGSANTRSFNYVLSGPGLYTVRVEVDQLGGGPFGLMLNGTANGKCDDRLEVGKDTRAEARPEALGEARAEECKDC